jgi:hypothetical protein
MPSPHIPCHTSTHTSWLHLWEMGWSLERIASTWAQPLAHVEEVLNELSMQPLPPQIRQVPRLPATPAEAQERRAQIQQLYRQGWSIERLARMFFYYSEAFLTALCQQAQPKGKACGCGCGERLRDKQLYATPACKQKAYRRRAVALGLQPRNPPLARHKV